ncbi:MAG: hypothetical protein Q8939_15320 [Bacteroidota bacterium]|nr:hypothetical protein [Bacteroidota bacterium]
MGKLLRKTARRNADEEFSRGGIVRTAGLPAPIYYPPVYPRVYTPVYGYGYGYREPYYYRGYGDYRGLSS